MRTSTSLLVVIALMFMGTNVFAEQPPPVAEPERARANTDQLFIKMAAIDNMFEIRLSEAATRQAQSQEVRQMAQQLIQDHRNVEQQLRQIAQQQNIDIPRQLPELREQQLQAITELRGQEFDRHYLSAMKAGHLKAVSTYADVAQLARDPQVQQFARNTLPHLQQHQQQIQQLATAQGLPSPILGEPMPAGVRIPGEQPRHQPDQQRQQEQQRLQQQQEQQRLQQQQQEQQR